MIKSIEKKGFTLIELMVVITIVVVLSTLGVGSFRSIRASVTLDIEVDKLVALVQKTALEVKSVSASQGPLCIKIIFEKDGHPQKITSPYINSFDGCEWSAPKTLAIPFSEDIGMDSNVTVSFVPPSGRMNLESTGNELILFLVRNPSMTRKIIFNAGTGTVEKIKK